MSNNQDIINFANNRFEKLDRIIHKPLNKDTLNEFLSESLMSENLSRRYFNRTCECGKALGFYEVAMFLRYYGRYANLKVDNRVYKCKHCMAEEMFGGSEKMYMNKVYSNFANSCTLF